uniref:Antimicrobial peptide UyCT3 n=1 Tax=Urodacus yaschenkoi TaxID=1273102 RepID=NDB4H_UROYA|nr:RecName: Full=Antimicrobial peptide UyCT3; Short=CT3; AltName: Full=Non-disulfide-bridged peptide 4.17; Short=NDBP-4.17; AltName: Full=Non-disulfide-bridged peptide 5.15; Short=NDBP-5.15; Flags: Precursor [Urodacus yaschenkoi]AGA82755.1 antimicrobial peptide CT3-NDBP-5.15 precursor [Urodacus yaschenkoi]
MKNQFVLLLLAIVFLQMIFQSDAILSAIWSGIKSLFGKRGLENMDKFDELFDGDLSEADLDFLKELMR